MTNEHILITRLEAADVKELARLVARPTIDEERALHTYLGSGHYQRFLLNHGQRLSVFLLIVLSCFFILSVTPLSLYAAGIVTTCDETHLRAALAGGGTVSFGCSGVITLTQTIEITPNLSVAIEGSGQAVTLSGNQETPVFYVPETAKLTLLNLTIADGVTVPLGGGILNRGAVTVTNSTFTNNWAYGGGAIANTGILLVQNSTFALNTADGGGFNSSGGGGILNYQGVVTITNSTFTDNVCVDDIGGALYNVAGTVRVINVTLAGNRATAGGSIANAGTLVVQNSLVTNSPAGGNCSGLLAAASTHNLSDDDTCGASFIQASAATINLGALTNNGGPTATIALNAGSVAIDAGEDTSCPQTDQRGVARPIGAHCDIGAFEFQPLVFLPVIVK